MKSEAQIKIDKELEEALDNLGGLLGHLTLCHARAIGTDRVGTVKIFLGDESIASFEMLPFVQDLGRVVVGADLSAEREAETAARHLEELEKARLEERVACLGVVEYLRSLPATVVLKDGALEKVRQMIEERGLPKETP
jgi:hypothetical protein